MAYIDYQVLAIAVDDAIAGQYAAWLATDLKRYLPGMHTKEGVHPTIEMQEPAPGTSEPRIVLRMVFDNEAEFRAYNNTFGPKLRTSLEGEIARWKQARHPVQPIPPVPPPAPPIQVNVDVSVASASAVEPDGSAGPPPVATPPPAPQAPAEPPVPVVRVTRKKTVVPRLPWQGALTPLLFFAIAVVALGIGTRSLGPLLRTVWPGVKAASATPAQNDCPEHSSSPAADVELDTKTQSPRVHRHAAGIAWIASYTGVIAMAALLVLLSLDVIRRNLSELLVSAPRSFDYDPEFKKRLWSYSISRIVVLVLIGLLATLTAAGTFVEWNLPITPVAITRYIGNPDYNCVPAFQRALRGMMLLTGLAGLGIAIAFGTLLFPLNAWNPRPVPVAVHVRLQSARFLLNAGSAMLVASVVQVAALTELALPLDQRENTSVTAFPLNYAIAWGAIFTVILAGLYVPTVAMLTSWGRRSVMLNTLDLKHSEVVGELETYSTGVRAEFKPYMSVLVALAPAAAAFLADLSKFSLN